MRTLTIILLLFTMQVSSFSHTHDIALVRPLINTNDSNGGYYSEYFFSQFSYMYCGAVVKNEGTAVATHVYLEMSIRDYSNNVLQTYYSDTIVLLNPGATVTVNIPGQLTFQPWISTGINNFLFSVKSDSLDENPANNQETVPFTLFFYDMWTRVSRAINLTNSYNISQSGLFQPGDFMGFPFSIPNGYHYYFFLGVYFSDPWPDSLQMTAMIFRNGQLICTTPFNLNYPPYTGWVYSQNFEAYESLFPDSSYYAGVTISWKAGTSVKIGADTSNYHNLGAETVARVGGTWTTLNFVPLLELICDPEGINEPDNPNRAKVYPNPAGEILNIENVQGLSIELYDLTGKMVFFDMNTNKSRRFDVSSLPKGIYLLRMTGKGRTESRKVVVSGKG